MNPVILTVRRALDALQSIPLDLQTQLIISAINSLEAELHNNGFSPDENELPESVSSKSSSTGKALQRRSACRKSSNQSSTKIETTTTKTTQEDPTDLGILAVANCLGAAVAVASSTTQQPSDTDRQLVARESLRRAVTNKLRRTTQSRRRKPTQQTDLPKPRLSQNTSIETNPSAIDSTPLPGFVAISEDVPLSRILFSAHDIDNSGGISSREFKSLVYSMGYYLSDAEVAVAVAKLDVDGSGEISYDEFLCWWTSDKRFDRLHLTQDQATAVQRATEFFQYFDAEEKGFVNRAQFWHMFEHLKAYFPAGTTPDQALMQLSGNVSDISDQHVNFNNYVSWLLRIGSLQTS